MLFEKNIFHAIWLTFKWNQSFYTALLVRFTTLAYRTEAKCSFDCFSFVFCYSQYALCLLRRVLFDVFIKSLSIFFFGRECLDVH